MSDLEHRVGPAGSIHSYVFEVVADDPFEIHPPFLYNTIKTPIEREDEDIGRLVLDASWWERSRSHTFTLTTQEPHYGLREYVETAVDSWDEFVDVEARIASHEFREVVPFPRPGEERPREIDLVLLETRSPLLASFRTDDGDREYASSYDLGQFENVLLLLIRRYKELYGRLDDTVYERIVDIADEVENVLHYFEYADEFPLRFDRSLSVRHALRGKALFRAHHWDPLVIDLFDLVAMMHVGKKTGYGLGGVDVTFLRQEGVGREEVEVE